MNVQPDAPVDEAPRRPFKWAGLGCALALHGLLLWAVVLDTQRDPSSAASTPMQVTLIPAVSPAVPAPAPPAAARPETSAAAAAIATSTPPGSQPAPQPQTRAVPAKPAQWPLAAAPEATPRPVPQRELAPAPEQPSRDGFNPPVTPATQAQPDQATPTEPTIPHVTAAPTGSPAAAHTMVVEAATTPVQAPDRARASAPPPALSVAMACPQQVAPTMPRQALRLGLEGEVQAELLIQNGQVVAVDIRSGPALFHEAVRHATSQYRCTVSTEPIKVAQTFVFKLN